MLFDFRWNFSLMKISSFLTKFFLRIFSFFFDNSLSSNIENPWNDWFWLDLGLVKGLETVWSGSSSFGVGEKTIRIKLSESRQEDTHENKHARIWIVDSHIILHEYSRRKLLRTVSRCSFQFSEAQAKVLYSNSILVEKKKLFFFSAFAFPCLLTTFFLRENRKREWKSWKWNFSTWSQTWLYSGQLDKRTTLFSHGFNGKLVRLKEEVFKEYFRIQN